MAFNSLSDFVKELEKQNELIRISEYVNPNFEITEITDRISKTKDGGKAILFENTGTDFPVLTNAMGSNKRICIALNVNDLDEIGNEIETLFKDLTSPKNGFIDKLKTLPKLSKISGWLPKQISGKGKCQEIINTSPDLSKIPILKCWPEDGGRFITLPNVVSKNPNTGIRNIGMYRMQELTKDSTGMHWHMHKGGAAHYNEYKKLNKKMPIAVTIGGDMAYTYSATAPLPDNIDEYLLAGFLRKKKVELVKCITQDIEVPSDVDFVIEGYVDPNEELIWEGPFGDHTGFYSLADWYPKFHITCITHKKDAIYPATIVGIPPQEDAWIGKATERIFVKPIQLAMLPELLDMDLPIWGVAHNLTIVKIRNEYPAHALKVMSAMWGAGQMMFNKVLVAVDGNVNIHNYKELVLHVFSRISIPDDLHFLAGPLDVLDHAASKKAQGGKLFIDATTKENTNFKTKYKSNYNFSNIKTEQNSIYQINTALLSKEIPLIFISFTNDTVDIVNKTKEIFTKENTGVKVIVIVDSNVNIFDVGISTWYCLSNIDPKRDIKTIEGTILEESFIIIDGTRKNKKSYDFKRDWPNVVVSDTETIKIIDKKWKSLNIGEPIISPSIKYREMLVSDGAIAIPK